MELGKEKLNLIFLLTLIGCLTFSPTPSVWGFIALEHREPNVDVLIHKVHKPSWKIGYRFSNKCSPEYRAKSVELEEMIATVLRAWLQPLRDMQLPRPITDDFQFYLKEDFKFNELGNPDVIRSVDVLITFLCVEGFSSAFISEIPIPPAMMMRRGSDVNLFSLSLELTHELGHAFGLADTYLIAHLRSGLMSSGGLANTVGTQPSSTMAGLSPASGEIGEDDKRGIIWLYKFYHEGLETEDCFFSDYVYEKETYGCRPKHPLIFEAKYGHFFAVRRILNEDPTIDVNAQDASGMTALHHAAALGREKIVPLLLAHPDIKPALRDQYGRTALDIAREENLTDIITRLQGVTPQQVVEDLNGDGTVNILDLVVVATNFGEKGKNRADVDGNGVVDIRDLVKVAGMLGAAAGS